MHNIWSFIWEYRTLFIILFVVAISSVIVKADKIFSARKKKKIIERISAGNYQTPFEYKKFVALWLEQKGYQVSFPEQYDGNDKTLICYDTKGNRISVVCKLYLKPVGSEAVAEAWAAIIGYKCNKAMVVTNNTYTEQAIEEANRTDVELWERVISKYNCP